MLEGPFREAGGTGEMGFRRGGVVPKPAVWPVVFAGRAVGVSPWFDATGLGQLPKWPRSTRQPHHALHRLPVHAQVIIHELVDDPARPKQSKGRGELHPQKRRFPRGKRRRPVVGLEPPGAVPVAVARARARAFVRARLQVLRDLGLEEAVEGRLDQSTQVGGVVDQRLTRADRPSRSSNRVVVHSDPMGYSPFPI